MRNHHWFVCPSVGLFLLYLSLTTDTDTQNQMKNKKKDTFNKCISC